MSATTDDSRACLWMTSETGDSAREGVTLRYDPVARVAGISRRPLRIGLVVLGVVLLQAAWVVGTPGFGGPDEPSHYLRALSIVNGQVIGPKVPYSDRFLSSAQLAFANHDTTAVLVPARLAPFGVNCRTGQPNIRGSCIEADPNGNFPPLPYLLPAMVLSDAHTAVSAFWWMRVASMLPALAFLILAVALLWDGTGWSLLGLLASLSPMVLFVSSVLNPSGLQITACLAFAAAALRIARDPTSVLPWVWPVFAVSGAVAILAGPIGLEFALFDLVVFGLVLGPRGLREVRARTSPRTLALSAVTLVTAGVLALTYTRVAGFSATIGFTPILSSLRQGVHQLPPVLRDSVGTFGALNVPLPSAARWVWWILVLALLISAILLGDRRERWLVVAVAVLGLAFPVLFYAWIDRFTGFGLQGREVLPALMLIPLVAGEVVNRHSPRFAHRPSARLILGVALGLAAAFQAFAWWYDAAKVTGAAGRIDFYNHADWPAPAGWRFWASVAAIGAVALLAFAAGEALNDARVTGQKSAKMLRRPSRSST